MLIRSLSRLLVARRSTTRVASVSSTFPHRHRDRLRLGGRSVSQPPRSCTSPRLHTSFLLFAPRRWALHFSVEKSFLNLWLSRLLTSASSSPGCRWVSRAAVRVLAELRAVPRARVPHDRAGCGRRRATRRVGRRPRAARRRDRRDRCRSRGCARADRAAPARLGGRRRRRAGRRSGDGVGRREPARRSSEGDIKMPRRAWRFASHLVSANSLPPPRVFRRVASPVVIWRHPSLTRRKRTRTGHHRVFPAMAPTTA